MRQNKQAGLLAALLAKVLLPWLVTTVPPAQAAPAAPAELIVRNGSIYTVQGNATWKTAQPALRQLRMQPPQGRIVALEQFFIAGHPVQAARHAAPKASGQASATMARTAGPLPRARCPVHAGGGACRR